MTRMSHGVMTIKWTKMNKSDDLRTGLTDRQPVYLFRFLPGVGASLLVVMCNVFQCIWKPKINMIGTAACAKDPNGGKKSWVDLHCWQLSCQRRPARSCSPNSIETLLSSLAAKSDDRGMLQQFYPLFRRQAKTWAFICYVFLCKLCFSNLANVSIPMRTFQCEVLQVQCRDLATQPLGKGICRHIMLA